MCLHPMPGILSDCKYMQQTLRKPTKETNKQTNKTLGRIDKKQDKPIDYMNAKVYKCFMAGQREKSKQERLSM